MSNNNHDRGEAMRFVASYYLKGFGAMTEGVDAASKDEAEAKVRADLADSKFEVVYVEVRTDDEWETRRAAAPTLDDFDNDD